MTDLPRTGVATLTALRHRDGDRALATVDPSSATAGMMPPPRRAPPRAAPGRAVPHGVARLTPPARGVLAQSRALREVMGRFATGVAIVTTAEGEEIHGMTANAFLSVSLTPPLVLISLGRCRMAEMLPRTGRYGVSVLSREQKHFAGHFAGQRRSMREPSFVWCSGFPMLAGAIAHLGCRVVDAHEAGDHVLWIGAVEYLAQDEGEPLLFYTGSFGSLAELEPR